MGKQRTEKDQNLIIVLCWLVYTAAYLGRYGYSANIPQIEAQFGVGHSATGLVGMCFFVAYGAGQVVNGIFCKRYPKRVVLSGVLALSAILNLVVWLGVGFAAYKYLWLVNGLAQSVLYSSLMVVIGDFVLQKNYKKAVFAMGTTVGVGTLLAYGMSFLLVKIGGYRHIFLVAFAVMAAVALVWFFGYGRVTKRLESVRAEIAASAEEEKEPSAGRGGKVTGGLVAVIALFAVFAVINNLIKDGLLSWVPSIMIESFSLPNDISTLLTVALPAVGIFGTALMLWLNKLCKNNYYLSTGILFLLTATLCFTVPYLTAQQSLWVLAIVCLAVVNCFMTGINNLIITVVPLSMRGRISAGLLAGLFDGFCYVGSAISTYGIGAIAESTGWNTVFYLFAACACVPVLVAAVVLPLSLARRNKKAKKGQPQATSEENGEENKRNND